MVMELRQLEYFIAVAEEANFTRAAERVHVSQSGISAQIRQLERDLGATLFDRSRRKASLTTAGAAALEHARAVLTSTEALRQAVDDVNGLIRGQLVVGMVTACTVTPLFDLLAGFHAAHSGVEVTLIEDKSDALIERVRARTVDLALIGVAGTIPRGLDALVIASEQLVAAVPFDHLLAKRDRATLSEIREYPIVCMPEGTGLRAVFDQVCAANAIQPHIAFQASAPRALADLAIRGLGIAILSESMAANFGEHLKAIALDDFETPAVLALVWTATDNPVLRELLRQVASTS